MKSKDLNALPKINKKLGVGLAAVVNKKLMMRRHINQQQLSDDSSFYDEEDDEEHRKFTNLNADDDSYYDEESDKSNKIGKGFDSESDVDLTEFTEDDVLEKKLELLHDKLDKEIEAGLAPGKDPSKLIELRTLRLNFLNIGPNIQSLEFFENLESLFLQHNLIQ